MKSSNTISRNNSHLNGSSLLLNSLTLLCGKLIISNTRKKLNLFFSIESLNSSKLLQISMLIIFWFRTENWFLILWVKLRLLRLIRTCILYYLKIFLWIHSWHRSVTYCNALSVSFFHCRKTSRVLWFLMRLK